MFFIENDYLRINLITRGAELKSIYNKIENRELLWQADPQFWGKSSPVLFPIVGALKDDCYFYNDKRYTMSRHGFARDNVFEIIYSDKSKIEFELKSNNKFKVIYPFDFHLKISYQLVEKSLLVNYNVINNSETDEIYFSLGAHPAFCVGNTSEEFSDYKLTFNLDNSLTTILLENNLLMDDINAIELVERNLLLNYNLFENDALVMHGLKSDEIVLSHNLKGDLFKFSFQNFPYFGIWTVQGANFICLEPWAGVADSWNHNQQLKEKEGINKLNPLASWEGSWNISVL